MKKIAVLSDFHCGHFVGLTPPGWWISEKGDDDSRTKRDKYAAVQRQLWGFYADNIKKHGPFDIVFINGDLIDGTGHRSGGTELITSDREEQAEMAVVCARKAMSKGTKVVITHGTAYHTGDGEDFENLAASGLGAEKIGSHEWVEVEGVMFDLKHHCGSSTIPHGRYTAPAKERLWNIMWNEAELAPKSDVIIRSHVHYYDFCGNSRWLGMTTPALQGMGSKYGSRRCSGIVDFGFVVFEVNKGSYSWHPVIANIKAQVAQAIKL